MKIDYSSLFWTVLGAILGVVFSKVLDLVIKPLFISLRKKYDAWYAERLYYSNNTLRYLKKYYNDKLHNCRIGNTSKQIAFISHPDWLNLNVDIYDHPNIIKLVTTDKCDYPIRKRKLESKKRRGYIIYDNPSLFLHKIDYKNNNIIIEVGEYSYYQRISFTTDFECETYNSIFFNQKKTPLRQKFFPKRFSSCLISNNTVPVGCDTVLAIRQKEKYSICISTRSKSTVNYPNGIMVLPSFGFGSIKNVNNPLLYSILREYCEELFDYKEMELIDKHINPYWFYSLYPEVNLLNKLKKENKIKILFIGCGYDVIGGFFNLETLLIVDDNNASNEIIEKCKGNWETYENQIQFVPIDSPLLEQSLINNHLTPSSSFAIQRSIEILSNPHKYFNKSSRR